jgi:hypothetical protein
MELEALKQSLALLDINPDEIKDERYANAFRILFSIIETQNEKIEFLMEDNQKLRDAINLLKGEQTKPKIRGSKKNEDISSEKERRKIKLP